MYLFYCLLLFSLNIIFSRAASVEYYENLINQYTEIIKNNEFATDASEYKPGNDQLIDAGTFDMIIVGTGTAGSIIANRLSEISSWNILALDAGNFADGFTDIPGMSSDVYFTEYGWAIQGVPQTTACLGTVDKTCPILRGRGIGGGSLINGMIYNRGAVKDFDIWQSEGGDEWAYDRVLESYKKSENLHIVNPRTVVDWDYHGTTGELNIEQFIPISPLENALYESASAIGLQIEDLNARYQLGISSAQAYVKNLTRQDTGIAFIKPILNERQNLVVLTRSYATKIGFDANDRATNVQFSHNNHSYVASASKEIILSAGTYGTPHLLMLSGIGPKQHLEDLGINVIQNLPVGENYQDQVDFVGLQYSLNETLDRGTLTEEIQKYADGVRGALARTGMAAIAYHQTALETESDFVDIEIRVGFSNGPFIASNSWVALDNDTNEAVYGYKGNRTILHLILMRPESTGTVKLKSSDPYDFPLVDPNLLSNSVDTQKLYDAIQRTMLLMSGDALRKIGAELVSTQHPACSQYEYLTKEYFLCAIPYETVGFLHPVASCRMGKSSADSVVDSRLKVHGITGLRIADASVFRKAVVGHPSATCMMVGERASDIIKEDYAV